MKLMKKLLIVSLTDARRDPRVYRQASFLREHYQVTVAGLCDPEIEGVAYHPIEHHPARHILERLWRAGTLLAGHSKPFLSRFRMPEGVPSVIDYDVAIINDAETLPIGFHLAQGAPVIFDAHEYYPRQYENQLFWRIFHKQHISRICKNYIPRCAAITTVCEGIAREYHSNFQILPNVIFNCPKLYNINLNPVSSRRIRLIHHGIAAPSRKIELMIQVAQLLDDRFSLDLMLMPNDSAYYRKIKNMADESPHVNIIPPVQMIDIVPFISKYDIGLCIFQPTTFNLLYCLPNKFFEFIQARLAIAVGPSPEMARLVNAHDLGTVAPDFSPKTIAAQLNKLTSEDVWRFKQKADNAAKIFNANREMNKLRRLLQDAQDY